jgi:hypothetical protein
VGQVDLDMNCTVGKGLPGPKEATVGRRGPCVGIIADVLDLECRGAPLAKESDVETLATHWQVTHYMVLIEAKKKHFRGSLVVVFAVQSSKDAHNL